MTEPDDTRACECDCEVSRLRKKNRKLKAERDLRKYEAEQLANELKKVRRQDVSPLTGEQLYKLVQSRANAGWCDISSEGREGWRRVASEIHRHYNSPDRREQLATEITVTRHGDSLEVLELAGHVAYVDSKDGYWYIAEAGADVRELLDGNSRESAEQAAREWLVERAMESRENIR